MGGRQPSRIPPRDADFRVADPRVAHLDVVRMDGLFDKLDKLDPYFSAPATVNALRVMQAGLGGSADQIEAKTVVDPLASGLSNVQLLQHYLAVGGVSAAFGILEGTLLSFFPQHKNTIARVLFAFKVFGCAVEVGVIISACAAGPAGGVVAYLGLKLIEYVVAGIAFYLGKKLGHWMGSKLREVFYKEGTVENPVAEQKASGAWNEVASGFLQRFHQTGNEHDDDNDDDDNEDDDDEKNDADTSEGGRGKERDMQGCLDVGTCLMCMSEPADCYFLHDAQKGKKLGHAHGVCRLCASKWIPIARTMVRNNSKLRAAYGTDATFCTKCPLCSSRVGMDQILKLVHDSKHAALRPTPVSELPRVEKESSSTLVHVGQCCHSGCKRTACIVTKRPGKKRYDFTHCASHVPQKGGYKVHGGS
mmetsp:Transcript_9839/g.19237  ORF Transcript_9839/g.19237 Transcript_9839/m.19237 type:complete len:419 (+) Transcript_9839:1293-2549(+)